MKIRTLVLSILSVLLLFSCSKDLAEYSYYKNIPEVTGTTSDDPPLFFIIKVDLGYAWGDKKTQYSLADLTPVINDGMRNLFSSKTEFDYTIEQEDNLKQEIMDMVNTTIHRYDSFKNVPGIKTVAIVKKQVFEFR
ncbi:hypothetical protein [Oceanispirochaeta sp.]|uniref:hypothetical protein n=1 Tax=Oceanispirochaeta sp. TaxID=2035350 RepID=UPI0026143DA7|nr:hypothetical protein [Oceanispirochaeta sp.]MDA3955359.1 hypothetical protein [Oceanispirochaeta sp.]